MTVERTRQLLGEKIEELTDEQVLTLIEKTSKSIDAIFTLSVKKAVAKQNRKVLS